MPHSQMGSPVSPRRSMDDFFPRCSGDFPAFHRIYRRRLHSRGTQDKALSSPVPWSVQSIPEVLLSLHHRTLGRGSTCRHVAVAHPAESLKSPGITETETTDPHITHANNKFLKARHLLLSRRCAQTHALSRPGLTPLGLQHPQIHVSTGGT